MEESQNKPPQQSQTPDDLPDQNLDIEPTPPENSIVEDTSPLELQLGLEEEQLTIVLPTTGRRPIEDWDALWKSLSEHLDQHQEFPVLNVSLLAQNQLLGGRQLQQLAELLRQHQLRLKRVRTSRRQTAIAAATAGYGVEQEPLAQLLADIPIKLEPVKPTKDGSDALYVSQTIRSGVEIRHKGSIVICGDVNPGGVIVADNDIVVWGSLRGIAHAGAEGDRSCRIMALQMQPTQLRIADMVARSSMSTPEKPQAEVAYLAADGIRLAPSIRFSKNYFYQEELENWEEMPEQLSF